MHPGTLIVQYTSNVHTGTYALFLTASNTMIGISTKAIWFIAFAN